MKRICFLFFLFSCPLIGQVLPQCYEQIRPDKINELGNALTYKTNCGNFEHLVLRNLVLEKDFVIEKQIDKTILTDDSLFYLSKSNRVLNKVSIENFKTETINDVDVFYWFDNSNQLLVYSLFSKQLRLMKDSKEEKLTFSEIEKFSVRENKLVTIDSRGEVQWIDLNTNRKKVLRVPNLKSVKIKEILWYKDGRSFVVIGYTSKEIKIFQVSDKTVYNYFSTDLVDQIHNTIIDTTFKDVRLLHDHKLALGVKSYKKANKKNEIEPEIWSSNTGGISSQIKKNILAIPQLLIIDFKNNSKINFFNHLKEIKYKIDVFNEQIYAYDENENNDFTQFFSDKSVNVLNQKTKLFQLFKTFQGKSNVLYNFKDTPYLFFFENNSFFFYDRKSEKINEIKVKDFHFDKVEAAERKDWNPLFSQKIFRLKKNNLLIKDQFDYWLLDSKKMSLDRLTSGREDLIQYKIEECNYLQSKVPWAWNYELEFKNYQDVILSWNNDDYSKEGISLLKDNRVEKILEDNMHISRIIRSRNHISYVKESANKPPELFYMSLLNNKEKSIYKSNVWDTIVPKLKIEYIQWKNNSGEIRGAILRYPLNYSSEKKYPAIVYIYEKRFMTRNHYQSPYDLNSTGFSSISYVKDDYFIVEPDLYYTIGKPGISAANDVKEALKVVLQKYNIDKRRLGIFGYSFGGYETNFILTQTNVFSAAASGAGVADLTSWYLTMGWDVMKPAMWRIENQQYRMGEGFFQNKEAYLNNSPVFQSENIQTPLLLFAGKKDVNVDWNQSVAMFLALKRQGKNVNLILYSDEGHTILRDKNLIDINLKVKNWFDFLLKNNKKPLWLN